MPIAGLWRGVTARGPGCGWYSRLSAARRTRSRVPGAICAPGSLSARLTVAAETPGKSCDLLERGGQSVFFFLA